MINEKLTPSQVVQPGSERSFGLVFVIVFLMISAWPLLSGGTPRLWSLAVAAVVGGAALVRPRALRPLNLLWFRFGMVLHKATTPLIMGLVFFMTVVPTGLIFRMRGKDPLRLRFEPFSASYWIHRKPPGPAPQTMTRQF